MTLYKKEILTATGTADAIDIGVFKTLTFGSLGTGGADYVVVIQGRLSKTGNWFDIKTLVDGELYGTIAGIAQARYNVTSMGAATSIDVEILGITH